MGSREARQARTSESLVRSPISGEDVIREIAALYLSGARTVRAGTMAERLWPDGRTQNANGQVFPLGAAVAARLLRKCPAVREKEPRLWEILPHRLPSD